MTCERHEFALGQYAIICGTRRRAKCVNCGKRADLECDWKVPGRKTGTCDKPICARCTTSPASEKDLCPEHAAAWADWQKARRT